MFMHLLSKVLVVIRKKKFFWLHLPFKKTQILQIGSFDPETAVSKLTALYCTSYGHAHLLKFKVHFNFKCGNRVQLRHRNTAAKTAIDMSAGNME